MIEFTHLKNDIIDEDKADPTEMLKSLQRSMDKQDEKIMHLIDLVRAGQERIQQLEASVYGMPPSQDALLPQGAAHSRCDLPTAALPELPDSHTEGACDSTVMQAGVG